MTYLTWRRELVRSAIDQMLAATDPYRGPFGDGGVLFNALMQDLSQSLPALEIVAAADDILTAHRGFCEGRSCEVAQALKVCLSMPADKQGLERRRRLPEQHRRGVQGRIAARHRPAQPEVRGRHIQQADTVAVEGTDKHDQRRQLEQHIATRPPGRAELQRGIVLKHQQHADLALLDEFLAVGLAEAGRHIPVDVAEVITPRVLHNLVELHAAPAEDRAVVAREHGRDRLPQPPLEMRQQRRRHAQRGRIGTRNGR